MRNTKLPFVLLLPLFFLAHKLMAQKYQPAERGSKMEFAFQKAGEGATTQKVRVNFTGMSGLITFDPRPQNLAIASFDLTLNAAGLKTIEKEYEIKLKGADYFDTREYPSIRLKSSSVTQDKPGGIIYTLNGAMTLKGITRPVKIQFTARASGTGYMFNGFFEFSKRAFGLGEGSELADNVTVYVQINANSRKS